MLSFLKKLLAPPPPSAPAPATVQEAAAASAARFVAWAEARTGTQPPIDLASLAAMDSALEGLGPEALEETSADLCGFLGEAFRLGFPESAWVEDSTYGPILAGFAGLPHAKLLPLALAEKRAAGQVFRFAEFAESFRSRVAAEAALPTDSVAAPAEILARLSGLTGAEAQAAARREAEQFRDYWKFRHRADLPMTLLGVREVERFLRTHEIANFLLEGRLVQAGFFVGEVGRGLFGGEWDLADLQRIDRAALRFPELDYLPVGRIYRLVVNGEAPQPLDEYIRLIPSARRELAKQSAGKAPANS